LLNPESNIVLEKKWYFMDCRKQQTHEFYLKSKF
jgi:hypothetical protein